MIAHASGRVALVISQNVMCECPSWEKAEALESPAWARCSAASDPSVPSSLPRQRPARPAPSLFPPPTVPAPPSPPCPTLVDRRGLAPPPPPTPPPSSFGARAPHGRLGDNWIPSSGNARLTEIYDDTLQDSFSSSSAYPPLPLRVPLPLLTAPPTRRIRTRTLSPRPSRLLSQPSDALRVESVN